MTPPLLQLWLHSRVFFGTGVLLCALTWLAGSLGFMVRPAEGYSFGTRSDDTAIEVLTLSELSERWAMWPKGIADPNALSNGALIVENGGEPGYLRAIYDLPGSDRKRLLMRMDVEIDRLHENSGQVRGEREDFFVAIQSRDEQKDKRRSRQAVSVPIDGARHISESRVFAFPTDSPELGVVVRMRGEPPLGSWFISTLELRAVELAPWYRAARVFLAGLWLFWAGVGAIRLARRFGLRRILPILALVITIVLLVSLGRDRMHLVLDGTGQGLDLLRSGWQRFFPSIPWVNFGELSLQKLGHAAAFLLLGAALSSTRQSLGLALREVLLWCVLLALITESVQRHIMGRTPSLGDVGIDVFGAIVGMAVGLVLAQLAKSVQSVKSDRVERIGVE